MVDATYVLVFVKERKETKAYEQAIVTRITLATQVEKYFMWYFFTELKIFSYNAEYGYSANVFAM